MATHRYLHQWRKLFEGKRLMDTGVSRIQRLRIRRGTAWGHIMIRVERARSMCEAKDIDQGRRYVWQSATERRTRETRP
jgi:hypothetical protein